MTGETVLVTDPTNGLGCEAALAMGRLGADVIVHGRKQEKGEEMVAELESLGSDAQLVSADFAEVEEVSHLAEIVRESADELDVLRNNAGGFSTPRRPTSASSGTSTSTTSRRTS